jgi:dTDP-glucose pyrophosphorylase
VDEIRVVTRPDKADVASCARALGAEVALGTPQSVGESIGIGAKGLGPEDVVLIGFPDTVWQDAGVYLALLGALGSADACLALFRHAEPAAADVVSLGRDGRVAGIEVKPRRPGSDLIWGCAVVRAPVLAILDAEPGRTFDTLARNGRVAAVRFGGTFADLGVRERLQRALAGAPLDAFAAG